MTDAHNKDPAQYSQSSSTSTAAATSSAISSIATAARERARFLFQSYVRQFTTGCGAPACPCPHCASHPGFAPLTSLEAATRAIDTIKHNGDRLLCPNIAAASAAPTVAASSATSASALSPAASSLASTASTESPMLLSPAEPSSSSPSPLPARSPALTSSVSSPLPESSQSSPSADSSTATAMVVTASPHPPAPRTLPSPPPAASYSSSSSSPPPIQYSDLLSLSKAANAQLTSSTPSPSLASTPFAPLVRLVGQVFADLNSLAHSFTESDSAHQVLQPSATDPAVDWEQVDGAFTLMLSSDLLSAPLLSAIRRLISPLTSYPITSFPLPHLRALFLLMECPAWLDPEQSDTFKLLCKLLASLRGDSRQVLINWYEAFSSERLERALGVLQQYITVRWYTMSRLDDLVHAVVVMSLLHAANSRHAARGLPHLPVSAFYNDAVNTELDLKQDWKAWKTAAAASSSSGSAPFAFASYPFILDAASKARLLQIDANQQMHREFQTAYIQSFFQRTSPYLVLRVHRSNLIQDTLRQLSVHSAEDFRKPLKVQFVGEQGIDEGGVRKEFFQLLVAELFDPAYGMFTVDDETRTYRFNPLSLESTLEFELIGIVLGLALYNSIILDIRFPFAVYKKLLNVEVGWQDLLQYNPSLARGLKKLEEDSSPDVEDVYAQTFTVDVDAFGEKRTEELKQGGASVPLTSSNRHEYIRLYVDWTLNRSIARQFGAFKKGFDLCVPPVSLALFVPEELELLICGSDELDFAALRSSTVYDDGYTADSDIVTWFWEVLSEYDDEHKKKLLMFCTGSDRVPIRGLGSMRFTVSRNGGDSDLLPTSHTCFNHLLLPEYNSKEKLRKQLGLALDNAHGFGLI